MSLLSQVNHHNKNGVYKVNLSKVNRDFLNLDSSFVWANTSDIDLNINFSIDNVAGQIISLGEYNNSDTGWLSIVNDSSSVFLVSIYLPSDPAPTTSFNVTSDIIYGSDNNISIVNREVFVNTVSQGSLSEVALNIDVNGSTRRGMVGNSSYVIFSPGGEDTGYYFMDGSIYNFTIDNKYYNLNEKGGFRFYGSDNTSVVFGSLETSNASGLTYVNGTMKEKI